eukprot:421640-Alexandrium_andersonii.AAC.1
MSASLVGSEMCIRDSLRPRWKERQGRVGSKGGNAGVPRPSPPPGGENTGGKRLTSGLPLVSCLAPRGRHHSSILRGAPATRERPRFDRSTASRDAE